MKKKVTLRELLGEQIVLTILIALYYWMWARRDWQSYYEVIQNCVAVFAILFFAIMADRIRKYKSCGGGQRHRDGIPAGGTAGGAGCCADGGLFGDGPEGGVTMALVTKLREYREKAGLKQADLAEKVGARRETIVHLEKGKYNPSLKLAMDIAKVFGVTVEELFTFTDE